MGGSGGRSGCASTDGTWYRGCVIMCAVAAQIGDNALLLLESIAAASPPSSFTVPQYISYWQSKWDVPTAPG